jgi:hypothetical protein
LAALRRVHGPALWAADSIQCSWGNQGIVVHMHCRGVSAPILGSPVSLKPFNVAAPD